MEIQKITQLICSEGCGSSLELPANNPKRTGLIELTCGYCGNHYLYELPNSRPTQISVTSAGVEATIPNDGDVNAVIGNNNKVEGVKGGFNLVIGNGNTVSN